MTDERFDELVLRHFDDALSEAEEHALAQRLAADPEARARFRMLSRLEGGTAHVARAGVLPSERLSAARASTRTRGRRSSWLPSLAAAAIVAVAALIGAWVLLASRPSEPTVLVTALTGTGTVHRGEQTLPLVAGMVLRAGDAVASAASAASVELSWRDEPTTLSLGSGATVRLASLRAPQRVELVAGALEAQVAPQPAGAAMVFACGEAEAVVVGTHLTLARDGARTRLAVVEGRVRLRDAGGEVEVTSGAVAEADAAAPPELVPVRGPDGVVRVATAHMLARAVTEAQDHEVIELAGGAYAIGAPLVFPQGVQGVVLRGAGPDPRAVRISGGGTARFLLEFARVSDITIANLSLEDAGEHLVFVHGELGCAGLAFSHVRFGASPGNSLRVIGSRGAAADRGTVVDCEFDNAGTVPDPNFLAYVDLVSGSGWRIARCRFHPMRLSDPAAYPTASAILLSGGGSGNIVEGNIICGCHRGITWGIGNGGPAREQGGGRIVDNMISRRIGDAGDAGISINDAPDVLVAHNTVLLRGTYPDAIEYRFAGAARETVVDNCLDGAVTARDGATATVANNVIQADPGWFVDADAGNLHLAGPTPPALQAGAAVAGVNADIDGDAFGAHPVIGADQPR